MNIQYAYELDELLKKIDRHSNCDDFVDNTLKKQLGQFKKMVSLIQPQKNLYDVTWSFWIPIPTGSFKHYLKIVAAEEEMEPAELADELCFEWEGEYPEKTKWYRLGFNLNEEMKEFCLSFDRYFIMIDKKGGLRGYTKIDIKDQHQLMDFIYDQLNRVVQAIIKNSAVYAKFLEKTLPKRYRFGRIKRSDYWSVIYEKNRVDKKLGKKRINKLAKILPEIKEGVLLKTMTANNFFRYCAIGYDANRYSQLDPGLSPVKKYRIMADMRDEGLTEIKKNSAKAFSDWYHSKRCGGHPWEICRGGNSTHISLYVSEVDGRWKLILGGSSYVRVVETVKMALALYDHGIIVHLAAAEEILAMVTGNDYIGLVPHDVTPRYCRSLFPDEDNIIDFERASLMEPDDYKNIERYIYWYPLNIHSPAA